MARRGEGQEGGKGERKGKRMRKKARGRGGRKSGERKNTYTLKWPTGERDRQRRESALQGYYWPQT